MAKRDAVPGIGKRLKDARSAAGLGLREAAIAASTYHSTLSTYESEKKMPTVAVLRRLAKAYGVTTCELIPEIEDKPAKGKTIRDIVPSTAPKT